MTIQREEEKAKEVEDSTEEQPVKDTKSVSKGPKKEKNMQFVVEEWPTME